MKRLFFIAGILFAISFSAAGHGNEVGTIGDINTYSKEVMVNMKTGSVLKMGDILQVETDEGKVVLEVTFPMQTVSKCRIKVKSKISHLKKGMSVYRYTDEPTGKIVIKPSDKVKKYGRTLLLYIEGGTYIMGSPKNEKELYDEGKQHEVTISSFYLGKYEITQKEYLEIMRENPSFFKGTNLPVEQVSWYNAVEFCNRMSEKYKLKNYYLIDKNTKDRYNNDRGDDLKYTVTILGGTGFRLPTEAEWEYACRAGTATPFHYGDKLDSSMANFNGEKPYNAGVGINRNKTTPVGSFKPNAFGLYDMHGNVLEWCWDWYSINYYSDSPLKDPQGASSGGYRILRGGSWNYHGFFLRSASRYWNRPYYRINYNGFRIARSL